MAQKKEHKLSWDKLLCSEAIGTLEKTSKVWFDYPINQFEHDYKAVITSLYFRAMQDKTQIYQLNRGDFVRTRLTHSLEVSVIGRQLVLMLYNSDKAKKYSDIAETMLPHQNDIQAILATAGLLHDMGNPPFGHRGEEAMGMWFEKNLPNDDFSFRGKPVRDWFSPAIQKELCHFEGNAQVLRILGKSRIKTEDMETNVSFATASTLLKYPVNSLLADKNSQDTRMHKFGYYMSEEKLIKEMREKTGLVLPEEPYARHPLTFLLEAADDISYICSDLEDSLVKGEMTLTTLINSMKENLAAITTDMSEEEEMCYVSTDAIVSNLEFRMSHVASLDRAFFQDWIGYLRNWLVYSAAESFAKHYDVIMDGEFRGELLLTGIHKYTAEIIKKTMNRLVYPKLNLTTARTFKVFDFLMDMYVRAALDWDTDMKLNSLQEACIDNISEKLKAEYKEEKTGDEAYDLYLRIRMVNDYLSGMTDRGLMELYQGLNGIG